MKDKQDRPLSAAAPVDDDGQRGNERDSLFLTGQLTLGGERQPRKVRIRNLSARGLMVELGRPAERGTPLTIELRGVGKVTGTVAWSVDGRIGVSLDTTVDPQRARKPIGRGGRTPLYARPPLG